MLNDRFKSFNRIEKHGLQGVQGQLIVDPVNFAS
jgi:hypothetical protein